METQETCSRFVFVVRIADLDPELLDGTWETRGNVVYKTPVLYYDTAKGSGSYFWFEVKDNDGGEIRIVCFNWLIDKFFDDIVVGNEYFFSYMRLKRPDDRYNWRNRPCEMILQYNSIIRAVHRTVTGGATQTPLETHETQTEKERKYTEMQNENDYLRKRLAEVEMKVEIMNSQLLDCRSQIKQLQAGKYHAVSL